MNTQNGDLRLVVGGGGGGVPVVRDYKDKGAYKVLWIFLILSFPIFGGFLYLLVHTQRPTRKMRAHIHAAKEKAPETMPKAGP
mgnify:CR=1 FL=1